MNFGFSHADLAFDQTAQQWIAKSNEACQADTWQKALDYVMVDA